MLTYTYKQPSIDVLKGKDTRGSILSSLHYWRKFKVPLLHDNLLHNQRFRDYIRRATSSDGDEWYRFVTRDDGDDVAADRRLLEEYNGSRLENTSRALAVQEECRVCEQELPGLCYPKRAQNTGRNEFFHACQVNDAIHHWIGNRQLRSYSDQELMIKTIKDVALAAAGIPLDLAYPLHAPMNTALNSVCPYSINKQACKFIDCSLRIAHVRFSSLCVDVHC